MNSKGASSGLNFGKPPRSKASTSSGTDWGKLLEQAATSGIMSAFGGGFGLGNLLGLGSIVSGITSLFGGGHKKQAALVDFQMPAAQNQTITVGADGNSSSTVSTQYSQSQNTQIAQAVRSALLQSSSLNDVIGEL